MQSYLGWGMALTVGFWAACTATVPLKAEDVGHELDRIVRSYAEQGKFGGAVLISRDEQVLLARGYGMRDREKELPNRTDSLFEIASLSKPITAVAVLLLQDDGRLNVQDPLAKHLPELATAYSSVSIFHVLTHTSGMPAGGSGRGLDFSAALAAHLSDGPEFPAGSATRYSNVGYAVLAGLVERVSGMTLEQFCRDRIFRPAGMRDTSFCGEEVDLARCAVGYHHNADAGRPPNVDPYAPDDAFGYEYRGMGGVVTTVDDLERFRHAAFGGLLSRTTEALMATEFRDSRSCGWEMFTTVEGIRCIGHGGGVRGYCSKLWYFPEHDATIVLLANQSAIDWSILHELYKVLFCDELSVFAQVEAARKAVPAPIDQTLVAPLLGRFECPIGLTLELSLSEQQLFGRFTPTPSARDASTDLQDAALAIVRGISRNDPEPLRARLTPRVHRNWPDWPDGVVTSQWPVAAAGGTLAHIEVCGSVEGEANYTDGQWTYVALELKFDEHSIVGLLTFNRDAELEMLILDLNQAVFGPGGAPVAVLPIGTSSFELRPQGTPPLRMDVSGESLRVTRGSLVFDFKRQ